MNRAAMTDRIEPQGPSADIVCFACGATVPEEPSYELLDQDDPCSACADRLLFSLKPILQMSPTTQATPATESESKP